MISNVDFIIAELQNVPELAGSTIEVETHPLDRTFSVRKDGKVVVELPLDDLNFGEVSWSFVYDKILPHLLYGNYDSLVQLNEQNLYEKIQLTEKLSKQEITLEQLERELLKMETLMNNWKELYEEERRRNER